MLKEKKIKGGEETRHTIFLFVVIAISLIFFVIVFWPMVEEYIKISEKDKCIAKYTYYCMRWINEDKEPGNWNEIEPKNCDKYGIAKPKSKEECLERIKPK